jgi:hypothetical protein
MVLCYYAIKIFIFPRDDLLALRSALSVRPSSNALPLHAAAANYFFPKWRIFCEFGLLSGTNQEICDGRAHK